MSDLMTVVLGRQHGGRKDTSPRFPASRLRAGIDAQRAPEAFARLQLSLEDASGCLGLDATTFRRRKAEGKRLVVGESGKVVRLTRVADAATEALGDRDSAAGWMKTPNVGATAALDIVSRIETGVYA
jgi:putative toxin-antitoxin system antitoxin component (TIGR02293 family)